MTQIELSVLRFFDSLTGWAPLDTLVSAFTRLGDSGFLFILLAAGLLCFKKARPFGICAALALVIDVLVVNVTLKPLFDRARPFEYLPQLGHLVPLPHDSSFPSGHTAAAFAFALAMLPTGKKWFVPSLVLAAAMGLSRLYVTVHFPTDVLAGAVIGALCGLLSVFLCKKLHVFHHDNHLGGN